MANAFQPSAFQVRAFQYSAGIPDAPRGFDETLAAFALERRRENEELELIQLMEWEAQQIIEAILPFVGHSDAIFDPKAGRKRSSRPR